jgi:pimeloyl-ACP methyl ester carboxylesterase
MPTWLIMILVLLAIGGAISFALKVAAERATPPIGQFIGVDGVRLHYLVRGPEGAPPLLLIHGVGGLIQEQIISGMVDRFAEKYRVYVFDRPGYGYSTRPRLRIWSPEAQAALLLEALQRLGVAQTLVVGHSWGTQVAVSMALAAPERVRGLVLAAGYFFPTRRLDIWLLFAGATPVIADIFRLTLWPIVSRAVLWVFVRKIFQPPPITDVFRDQFPTGLATRPMPLRASCEEAGLLWFAARRLQERYAALACPMAIVVGEDDWLIEAEQSKRLKAALPRAVLRQVPGHGHMLTHTATAEVISAVDLIAAWP